MKRIFIALNVEAGDTLQKMISLLKSRLSEENIRWTNPENIHITLSFLGDTEEKWIKDINSMLKNKCEGSGRFDMFIKGFGVFRNVNDPRIIWFGIEPSAKLMSLNGSIMKGLTELGIKIEDRPFKPHLTIGRIKHLNDKVTLKALIDKYQNSEIQKSMINEVILFESILLQSGPLYKPLAKFTLE
ncbi:MAG TPA: RNA 2',3'-cyclic phosphodiesterase [Bacteroidales bacterium]